MFPHVSYTGNLLAMLHATVQTELQDPNIMCALSLSARAKGNWQLQWSLLSKSSSHQTLQDILGCKVGSFVIFPPLFNDLENRHVAPCGGNHGLNNSGNTGKPTAFPNSLQKSPGLDTTFPNSSLGVATPWTPKAYKQDHIRWGWQVSRCVTYLKHSRQLWP